MKHIKTQAVREEATYTSDFSGKNMGEISECEITFEFNYGSPFDTTVLKFDLTSNEAKALLQVIGRQLSKEKHKELLENTNIPEALIKHIIFRPKEPQV